MPRIMGSLDAITGTVKENVTGLVAKTGVIDVNKQKMKPLVAERAKMYEFIGMEVYDLHKAGKINLSEIEPFCRKIDELNVELSKLEPAPAQVSGIACDCGATVQEGAKFCMACGKAVEASDKTVCTCGASIVQGAKFCAKCGKAVDICLSQSAQIVECVCGAVIEPGSLMCMECGRRAEVKSQ